MTRLRILALVLVLLAAPSRALAQQIPPEIANSTPEQRAKVQTLAMKEKLGLSAEQLPKVEAINLQTAQQMEPVMKGDGSPLVKTHAAKVAQEERDTALRSVLTPSQFQQYQAMRAEAKLKAEQRLIEKKAGGGAP